MSTREASALDAAAAPAAGDVDSPTPAGRGRSTLFAAELRLVFRRWRHLALLAVLVGAVVLLGVAVRVSTGEIDRDGSDLAFVADISQNGVFLALSALTAALPFFLPLSIAVVAGDSVAGEAGIGTLRYLLVVPVSRTRLLVVKYLSIVTFAVVASLTITVSGVLLGWALFGVGPVTLISGSTVSLAEALWRLLLVTGYVAVVLASLGAIGLFASTLTEVPIAAMAGTVVVAIVSQILDALPQLEWLHAWLPTHWWLSFGDLLRTPVPTDNLSQGLLSAGTYAAVFLALAWARFTTKDVTG